MQVDGVDGTRVVVSNTAALSALDGTTALTLETWMNPATVTLPSHYRLFYGFPGQGADYVGLYDDSGTPRVIVSLKINGVQRVFVAGPAVTVGTWYHVVVTYDGAAVVLYVNGVAVGQVAASGPVSLGTGGRLLGGYPTTGLISGSVTAAPGSYPVTVSVTDGSLTTTQSFTWTVPQ